MLKIRAKYEYSIPHPVYANSSSRKLNNAWPKSPLPKNSHIGFSLWKPLLMDWLGCLRKTSPFAVGSKTDHLWLNSSRTVGKHTRSIWKSRWAWIFQFNLALLPTLPLIPGSSPPINLSKNLRRTKNVSVESFWQTWQETSLSRLHSTVGCRSSKTSVYPTCELPCGGLVKLSDRW